MVAALTLPCSVSTKNLQDPYFMKYQIEVSSARLLPEYNHQCSTQAVNEMVSTSINHPCVIFHGFFNEGPSNDVAACPG